jgi:hypothetical protein
MPTLSQNPKKFELIVYSKDSLSIPYSVDGIKLLLELRKAGYTAHKLNPAREEKYHKYRDK